MTKSEDVQVKAFIKTTTELDAVLKVSIHSLLHIITCNSGFFTGLNGQNPDDTSGLANIVLPPVHLQVWAIL